MSVLLDAASNQYLSGVPPIGAVAPPYTVSLIARITATIGTATWPVWIHDDSGAGNQYYRLSLKSGGAVLRLRGSVTQQASSSATMAQNVWQHWCAPIRSTSDRSIFIDGGDEGNNSASLTINDSDTLQIGGQTETASYWTGEIAEVAIWRGIRSPSEIAQLGRFISPISVASPELLFYATLLGGTWFDCIGGQMLTPNGAPLIGVHPPMVYPAGFEPGTRTVVDPMRFISGSYRRTYFGNAAAAAATRRVMIDDALIVIPA